MERKSVALTIKSADDETGTFTGPASVFGNLDSHGDIVRRGAFSKSLASGQPIPLLWMHGTQDPRCYVGHVVQAHETAEGMAIEGQFDLDTRVRQVAYRHTKGRRVSGLSIGYAIRNSTKTAGYELTDLELIESSCIAVGCQRVASGAMGNPGQAST